MNYWPANVAVRYIYSDIKGRLLSPMITIAIAGLVLGVAILVIVLSMMNGFERELRHRVLSVIPHGVISSSKGLADWRLLMEQIESHPEVIQVAPIEEGKGLLVANGEIVGVNFSGVEPNYERNISPIGRLMVAGQLESLKPTAFNILLGVGLATKLGVSIGDQVTVVLPYAQVTLAGLVPRTKRFYVSGLFQTGSDTDKHLVLTNLKDALRLTKRHAVSSIRVQVGDLFQINRILREIMASLNVPDLYASTWLSSHGNLYDAIQTQKLTLFLLLLLLVAIAAFNLVSNLILFVNEKHPDIAILRTMGASRGEIRSIFIISGAIIGSLGIFLGLFLGLLLANYMTEVYQLFDDAFNFNFMGEYFIHYLPSRVLWSDILLITGVSALLCLVATVYPASIAAKSDPIEALHHE